MTIYEIKRKTQETEPYFFDQSTMRFFGQSLKDFRVKKQPDGRYKISAPNRYGTTVRYFNPQNNELEEEAA